MNAETRKAESAAPPVAKRRPRPEKKVEITDPKAIRALAHAARLEVISELYSTQVSRTATELAAQTGLTPSAMSYHLRALQKWGIVVPAATAGDARERRWKAAGTDFTINSGGGVASPEFAVLDLELAAFRRRVNAYARTRDERRERGESTDGPSSVVLASNLLYLTPDQRTELTERLFDLLRDYELEDPDRVPEGAQRMATMWSMIPDDRGNAAAGSGGSPESTSRAPGDSGDRPA
ncbi:DNA-binding transcriptional ArsR family regulator [Arthrobacter sp. V4I6]|uniref:ArsR/SmtB family transcription factor n=1 Tax=unclassified Arthrobacter TaxID=235627 RepID=UPI0027869C17|nr:MULTISPECIES: winged helix-turn-helix domain-containing protein [unclassified Arthrobacter]MDQ0819715.1 DNA-binding transcriptional ArsR family regulator [Arthrobacter sp. V1I7]MDQ0853895.1 DNA-binding transcriptional ArsR family regulator [Arthrobacter sp. V4I6]